jgi:hypothetical protein
MRLRSPAVLAPVSRLLPRWSRTRSRPSASSGACRALQPRTAVSRPPFSEYSEVSAACRWEAVANSMPMPLWDCSSTIKRVHQQQVAKTYSQLHPPTASCQNILAGSSGQSAFHRVQRNNAMAAIDMLSDAGAQQGY